MQGSNSQNSTNVVSLFGKKQESTETNPSDNAPAEGDESFDSVMDRNMKNNERLRKERLNANKSVLRSYRIKN